MQLLLNGNSLRVEQMGPDFLIVKEPIDHLPTGASLELRVDDSISRWNVNLPNGISKSSPRIVIGTGA
jgi:hypothetical protein